MNQERILHLFTHKLTGTLTPSERAELEDLLRENPQLLPSLKLLEKFWNDREQTETINVEASLQKVLRQIQDSPEQKLVPVAENTNHQKDKKIGFRWRVAASLAGLVLLSSIIFYSLFPSALWKGGVAWVEKHNGKGVKSTIELPDGSKIWLNADSKFSYPETFNVNTREVRLQGEAFFEVQRNPAKPFIIHLNNGTVRVLGTSFNVRAYDDEDRVVTSVRTGKVAFIPKNPKNNQPDTVFLTPDKKVVYGVHSGRIITQTTHSEEDKAWVESKLIFKSMTLEEIAHELERTFGKKVVFRSQVPRKYRLTGTFQNNTLEEIMFYLSKTRDFSYQITNDELLIASDPSELTRD